jgi:hypothetical protein
VLAKLTPGRIVRMFWVYVGVMPRNFSKDQALDINPFWTGITCEIAIFVQFQTNNLYKFVQKVMQFDLISALCFDTLLR